MFEVSIAGDGLTDEDTISTRFELPAGIMTSKRAGRHWAGNICAKYYESSSLPSDPELESGFLAMLEIYEYLIETGTEAITSMKAEG